VIYRFTSDRRIKPFDDPAASLTSIQWAHTILKRGKQAGTTDALALLAGIIQGRQLNGFQPHEPSEADILHRVRHH
jgi:hypothetical protein